MDLAPLLRRSLMSTVAALSLGAVTAAPAMAQSEPASGEEPGAGPWVAGYEWQEVKPSRFGGAIVGDVVASSAGHGVALGLDLSRKVHARSYFSRDGEIWKSKAMPGGYRTPKGGRHVSPGSIVSTPDGLFAVGGFREPGKQPKIDRVVVWQSGSGRTWSEAATITNAVADDIAAGPDGLLIAGVEVTRKGRQVPTVWHAADGSSWQAHRLVKDGPRPRTVAVTSDGVALVLGHDYRTGKQDTRTWLWRSVAGGEWVRVALPGGLDEGLRMSVVGPVATPRGFLMATRQEERIVDQLWQSQDGLAWQEVPMPDGWTIERSWAIAQPWPWRSLVLTARALPGMTQQPSLLLTTDGGETWCVADSPATPGYMAFDVSVGPDGAVYMVGAEFPRGTRVWVARPTTPAEAADGEAALPCGPVSLAEVTDFGGRISR